MRVGGVTKRVEEEEEEEEEEEAGSLVERHIDSDGGEQGFIWDYLTAYTHTHTHTHSPPCVHTQKHEQTHTHTHTHTRTTHTDAGINKNTFSPRDERKIGALTGEVL